MQSVEQVLRALKKEKVDEIGLVTHDLVGQRKTIYIPARLLGKHTEDGKGFDGSSVPGFRKIKDSDMLLMSDLTSFYISPLPGDSAYVMCDVYESDKTPFEGDPRRILKKQAEKAGKMGYTPLMGPELEFFLLKDGQLLEQGSYSSDGSIESHRFRKELADHMSKIKINWILHHHEVAQGQHEVNYEAADPVKSADTAMTVKYLTKMLAKSKGYEATYIPKFRAGMNGSGMHVHQSLVKNRKNAFDDGKGNFSDVGRHYIAGLLEHLVEMTAVLNPLPTSYKRLVPGYEAPNIVCWGEHNRSTAVRVPLGSRRAELRSPDTSCNVYLAFALMLAAGLDGIERKLKLPPKMEENAFDLSRKELESRGVKTLPGSLDQALDLMEDSKFVKDVLGEWTFSKFLELGRKEAKLYKENVLNQVSQWERDRYMNV